MAIFNSFCFQNAKKCLEPFSQIGSLPKVDFLQREKKSLQVKSFVHQLQHPLPTTCDWMLFRNKAILETFNQKQKNKTKQGQF